MLTLSGAARKASRRCKRREALRQRLQVDGPVEGRVAAADDEDALAAEGVHLAHGVEHAGVLVGVDIGDRRLLRLERAAARRNEDALASEGLAGIGGDAETRRLRRADRLHGLDHLAEMEGRLERLDLAEQVVDEALAGDDREAGDVVDRLLRIKLGALAADLGQDIDEVGLDVEEAELEHREQADRPRSYDHHVGFDHFAHQHVRTSAPCPSHRPSYGSIPPLQGRAESAQPTGVG